MNDAYDQYRWTLHNPFTNLKKHLPKASPKRREGFRFDEWLEFLQHIDPWYQPIVELMILTGMINSEIAGLRKTDIRPDYILVQHTIVRGQENDTPKTLYRIRKKPITQAIRNGLIYSWKDQPVKGFAQIPQYQHSIRQSIDSNKLVRLMGHGSKQMVYEVYGDYIEGLEEDFWGILVYMGRDFVEPKSKKLKHSAIETYRPENISIPAHFSRQTA